MKDSPFLESIESVFSRACRDSELFDLAALASSPELSHVIVGFHRPYEDPRLINLATSETQRRLYNS